MYLQTNMTCSYCPFHLAYAFKFLVSITGHIIDCLYPVHTSPVAWFGTVRLDKKCNVNTVRTGPNRTEPAHPIEPGQHGTVR